jgi:hypothetical protein
MRVFFGQPIGNEKRPNQFKQIFGSTLDIFIRDTVRCMNIAPLVRAL